MNRNDKIILENFSAKLDQLSFFALIKQVDAINPDQYDFIFQWEDKSKTSREKLKDFILKIQNSQETAPIKGLINIISYVDDSTLGKLKQDLKAALSGLNSKSLPLHLTDLSEYSIDINGHLIDEIVIFKDENALF